MAYIVKRVLRGFATIKSLTLLKGKQGLIIRDYARLSKLYHNQVVQALVGQQRLKVHGIYCEEGFMRLCHNQVTHALEGMQGFIIREL
jgi:hypothetical protein